MRTAQILFLGLLITLFLFPQFASATETDGTEHIFYIDSGTQHIIDAWSDGSWHFTDMTSQAGAPLPATDSPLTAMSFGSVQYVWYIDSSRNVEVLSFVVYGNWSVTNLTALLGFLPAESGSGLSSTSPGSDPHVYFIASNSHVIVFYFTSNRWSSNDLTTASGGPNAVAGSAITSFVNGSTTQHVYYIAASGDINELYQNTPNTWANSDITVRGGGAIPMTGTSLTSYPNGSSEHVHFIATSGFVNELYWTDSTGWVSNTDMPSGGAPTPATGTHLSAYMNGSTEDVTYIATTGHVCQLFWNGTWNVQDLTETAGAPDAEAGSSLASYLFNQSSERVWFVDGSLIELIRSYGGPAWTYSVLSVTPQAKPLSGTYWP
jgi:hypothetical protein